MSERLANVLLAAGTVAAFSMGLASAELALRLFDPDYFYRLYAEESSNVYSETYGCQRLSQQE